MLSDMLQSHSGYLDYCILLEISSFSEQKGSQVSRVTSLFGYSLFGGELPVCGFRVWSVYFFSHHSYVYQKSQVTLLMAGGRSWVGSDCVSIA